MAKEKRKTRSRYKNQAFLTRLGEHCRRLRLQRGFSVDRLVKESEQLSPASVDRLERGLADSQILVLVRYADVLNVSLLDLFSFLKEPVSSDDSRIISFEKEDKRPQGFVPVYPLKVAAGELASGSSFSEDPVGWVDANLRGSAEDYFASFVTGTSMEPKIPNGSLCLFKKYSGGTRQGKVFLIQARGVEDLENSASFVVKKYVRQSLPRTENDESEVTRIHLVSENPRFSPIVLVGLQDEEIQTLAEFIRVIP